MALRTRRTLAFVGVAVVAAIALVGFALVAIPQNNTAVAGACLVPPQSCLFNISGTMAVTSESGSGLVNLTINNEANYPFTSISLTETSPTVAGIASSSPFTYNGVAISISNPLQIGSYSSGVYDFNSGGNIGTTYTIFVTVTMTNGQVITEKTNLVAIG